jgi:tetratricopeptide (TPR) repeat protein
MKIILIAIALLVSGLAYGQTADAYYNRGLAKSKLEDYRGAITDYSKAIELNPNYANAYYNRGKSKGILEDDRGAIADYSKAY